MSNYREHRDRPEAAERAAQLLIGGAMFDPAVVGWADVEPEAMPTPEAAAVWRVLVEYTRAHPGVSIEDPITLASRSGVPPEWVRDCTGLATEADARHNATIIRQHAERRKLMGLVDGLRVLLDAAPVNVAEQLDGGSTAAEAILAQIRHLEAAMEPPEALRPMRLSDACRAFVERPRAAAGAFYPWPGPAYPSATGEPIRSPGQLEAVKHEPWAELAKVAHLGPESLAVLVGPTGRGKTALALQVAAAVAETGVRVLYASAELPADELVSRVIACRAGGGMPWRTVLAAPGDEHVKAAATTLAATSIGKNLMLWTPMGRERHGAALATVARQAEARFIVVDYVQRFIDDDGDTREAVRRMSGLLRDLSRQRQGWPGAAVLALSSIARPKYPFFATVDAVRQSPVDELEGSGKECGELEYDATLVLAYTADRGEDGRPERPACIRVVKQRGGVDGAEVGFTFHGPAGRFTPRKLEPRASAPATQPRGQGAPQRGVPSAGRHE